MQTGEHIVATMKQSLRRAQGTYTSGNRELARYWLGGCAMLHLLAQNLRADRKIAVSVMDGMIELAARGRAIFEERDLGSAGLGAADRTYPDDGAMWLDHFMAECGM